MLTPTTRRLLVDVTDRARRRHDQMANLTAGGPIRLALADAQRSDLALLQLLLIVTGDEVTGMDEAAERTRAVWRGRTDATALLDDAERIVGPRGRRAAA